jgi:hypothetical protein
MGPNIRYAYREYWDYYDHYLPLSHLSLGEGLTQAGFAVERVSPRFLPYTMKSSLIISNRNELHDDPVVFAITDRVSWATALCVGAVIATAIP